MAYIRIAFRPALITTVILVLATAGLLLLSSASAGDDGPHPGHARETTPAVLGEELTAMRTRTSKTFTSPEGLDYVTRLFADTNKKLRESGKWRPNPNKRKGLDD